MTMTKEQVKKLQDHSGKCGSKTFTRKDETVDGKVVRVYKCNVCGSVLCRPRSRTAA